MQIRVMLSLIPRTFYLVSQLFWIWMTLGWRVRKTKKAFERELIRQGMKKEDAERLSQHIANLKDQMMSSFFQMQSID